MDVFSIVTVLIGGGGLAFGLYEYHVGQKWKRAEFAGRQLERLSDDPILARCCLFLDYSTRKMSVPAEYLVFTKEESFIHNWDTLEKGLLPEEDKGRFDWQEVMYRDSFDRFFAYLERIDHFISIRLIDQEHVSSLEYWLEEVAKSRFSKSPVFVNFLERYGYDGVLKLMDRFQIQYQAANQV
jgi:hypothetical protein